MQIEQLRKRLAGIPNAPRFGVRVLADMATDRSGTTVIDYAFLISLVALAAVQGFYILGTAVGDMFDAISTIFVQATAPSP